MPTTHRTGLTLCVAALAWSCGGATPASSTAPGAPTAAIEPDGEARPSRPPVVMVSVDGLRPDYVLRADALGLAIPTLRSMVKDGSTATGVRGVAPTVTYPSHTTLVTGVAPNRHGILNNTSFDPLDRNAGGWHWYAEDVRVPTLWQVVRDAGMRSASFFWPVNVGANASFVVSEVWRADAKDDRKLTRATSTPGLVRELEAAVGELPEGHAWDVAADRQRARAAAHFLERHRPDLLTLHLLGLDSVQHVHGPGKPEVFEALEQLDQSLGSLRESARRAGAGKAVFCVVSDHGFRVVEKKVNLLGELVRAGLVTRGKDSWSATVWTAGGSAAIMVRDPDDASLLERVRGVLKKLAADPKVGIERVLESEAVRALQGYGDASFVVAMRPGFSIESAWEGPLVRDASPPSGGHGFLPDDDEMNATFSCEGPGIAAGVSLGVIDMRDVAPSLAALLGVSLPDAEGRDVLSPRP